MRKSVRSAVLLNDTTVDKHHGCSTVVESIHHLAAANGITIVASAPAHSNWQDDHSLLSALDDAELIIVNGEGTIHHDRPAARHLLVAGSYARSKGKSAALINTTWDGNGSEYSELARSFDLIAVRESASQAALADSGISARVVADLALHHQPATADHRAGVAYTDSVVGRDALAIYERMGGLDATAVSLLYGRRTARDAAVSVRRFLYGQGAAAIKILPAALRGAMTDWQSQMANRDEFARCVARHSLMVTGRFHMLIFCLSTRTPFLAIESNTHKIGATLRDVGLMPWRLVSTDGLEPELIERASHWHEGEQEKLEHFIATNRAEMSALFKDISQL